MLSYVREVTGPVDSSEYSWLTGISGGSSIAARELVFLRRAIGLIVADRDALDDRTASEIAHELAPMIASESRRDPEIGKEWNTRWRAYTSAMALRGTAEPPASRLAVVFLTGVGISHPTDEQSRGAALLVQRERVAMNEALRKALGTASLPDNVKPSAMQSTSAVVAGGLAERR